ncbi:MAG: polysaccharide deacetylase family protein [Caldilineaceae bacterium]|nr:polysaccharide deacetylase family protein [Caldilineaceae bacterium]
MQVFFAGCATSDVFPTPTATKTPEAVNTLEPEATHTPTLTPEAVSTPAPEATATAIHEESLNTSKYDNVFVYTVEEKENEGRSLLHVAYPVTEQGGINARLEERAQEFIDEFHTIAAEQEAAYQTYLRDTGNRAISSGALYNQHFDVIVANTSLISFAIEQYRSLGNTGSTDVTVYFFDRISGTELTISDLFVDESYLTRLSTLTREELDRRALIQAFTQTDELDFSSNVARQEWLHTQRERIYNGTEPVEENFDSILFEDEGTVRVIFDRYQVGPGSDGVVEVTLPVASIADLLTPAAQELLGIEAKAPTPAALPSATPVPTPTLTPTPIPDTQTAPPPPAQPQVVQTESDVNCAEVPCVALTFDDGPSVFTDGLLDLLKARNVHATFFVLGQSVRVQPETIVRMKQEGHQIGNHTWDHSNLTMLPDALIKEQIAQTDNLIIQLTGEPTQLLRPPYGAYDEYVLSAAQLPLILWSVDPLDWKDRDAEVIASRISDAPVGSIILVHDIHKTTVAAIPAVIDAFGNRGISLVTVSQLLAPLTLVSGQAYRQRIAP